MKFKNQFSNPKLILFFKQIKRAFQTFISLFFKKELNYKSLEIETVDYLIELSRKDELEYFRLKKFEDRRFREPQGENVFCFALKQLRTLLEENENLHKID